VLIVREALAALGVSDEQLAWQLARRYRELRDASLRLHDGAIETLVALDAAGYALGLITNGSAGAQRAKIERFALGGHFSYIGIEGEAGVGKPDGEAYRRALRALGCAPQAAWMVGDNLEWDVAGAQRAGLSAVWVDYRATGLPHDACARPDHVVTGVGELV
jgi:putative hydrolase of the HAD superfamily